MTIKDWKWALYDKEGKKLQVYKIDLITAEEKEKALTKKLFETKSIFMEGKSKKEAVEKVKKWYLEEGYEVYWVEQRI